MKWFNNMKIGKKLTFAFFFITLFSAIVGAMGIYQMITIERRYTALYESYGVSLGYLTKVTEGYQMRRGLLKDLIIQTSPEEEQKVNEKIKAVDIVVSDNMKLYQNTITNDADREIFNELSSLLDKYNPLKDGFVSYALAHEDELALGLMSGDGAAISTQMEDIIEKIIQNNLETGKELSSNYNVKTNTAIGVMAGIVLLSMILALIFGSAIAQMIGKPIKKLVTVADKIAEGDLNVSVDINTKDEVGMLAKAFQIMSENLNETMSKIREAAVQVASGSKQVSDSSMTLSEGATEQASSIEELTASLEEISIQTSQNADNANQANMLAEKAKVNAVEGNEQMAEMLKAMEDINHSSSNISKIIKVIDDIAFQTNILALNAAVEAARAGQHGKGFAVVAEEVRNLAARSANAAKETTDMIEGSIRKVEGGTKTANQTANALNMIVEGVAKVANLVGNIATASNEQAAGIKQINQGIMQVSSVVQTNSATSEESAAASEELASQAELLNNQVSKFNLREERLYKYHEEKEFMSQDVLRMLDNMQDRNTIKKHKSETKVHVPSGNSPKILLSDKEFGKY
ncbi:MAG: methyl-accepting chemotaxis protein [Herbinix sp.]|nr:methyl-accepting chemotaxis protein [Herbinix sp.]